MFSVLFRGVFRVEERIELIWHLYKKIGVCAFSRTCVVVRVFHHTVCALDKLWQMAPCSDYCVGFDKKTVAWFPCSVWVFDRVQN